MSNEPVESRPTVVSPSPEDKRRKRLASYSVQNMIWSTLAVGAVALAWWSLTFNPSESQRRPPEVTQTATYVVEQSPWPVWVPEPGDRWVPTVVSYEPLEGVQTWHISYTSPEGEYVALHQAADVTDTWRAAVLGAAQEDGEVRLDGPGGTRIWQAWEGEKGSNSERAYVLGPEETGGSTTVLHGTASPEEFQAFLKVIEARD
ncbi:DUF4245 domain-containing protein [Ornithinimicrobium tianjinense]|uniref:DUF4245 domain-containing protein n=1 Tax=Ornithinimicrobium tianjinense TaxID=1195761 RepID=A0A917BW96_9MICO|nr:DUF4245 domain-containing protein [Ornithinimicrobium tianjinense]GGF59275.1 hypothetical protein GCM10011366_28930 [Ornithinimicrobium tianjinense]